jgi:hypothetical protein
MALIIIPSDILFKIVKASLSGSPVPSLSAPPCIQDMDYKIFRMVQNYSNTLRSELQPSAQSARIQFGTMSSFDKEKTTGTPDTPMSDLSTSRAEKLAKAAGVVAVVVIMIIAIGYFWNPAGEYVFYAGHKVLSYAASRTMWGRWVKFLGLTPRVSWFWTVTAWSANLLAWTVLGGTTAALVSFLW